MPEEIVRNCHSDIRLNMSVVTLSQLMYMVSFSVKFTRLIDGENSSTYKTAIHWQNQLKRTFDEFESTYLPNSDSVAPISSIMRSFHD